MRKERIHKTAILVVSFGTTHLDTLERSIKATEDVIAESFPEYPVYRAFLSPTVMRRLKERYQLQVDNVTEALNRIVEDGCQQVIIQPTLLLRAIEYELLLRESKAAGLLVSMGRPLLENREDCEALVDLLIEENPLEEKEALVLMGHGTEHSANDIYGVLQECFERRSYPCFIGTVDGTPTFADVVEQLKQIGVSKARLLPLMFVAGDHARNDMAGEEDSLLAAVEAEGIQAEPVFHGLGERKRVQKLYVERIEEAMQEAAG